MFQPGQARHIYNVAELYVEEVKVAGTVTPFIDTEVVNWYNSRKYNIHLDFNSSIDMENFTCSNRFVSQETGYDSPKDPFKL